MEPLHLAAKRIHLAARTIYARSASDGPAMKKPDGNETEPSPVMEGSGAVLFPEIRLFQAKTTDGFSEGKFRLVINVIVGPGLERPRDVRCRGVGIGREQEKAQRSDKRECFQAVIRSRKAVERKPKKLAARYGAPPRS